MRYDLPHLYSRNNVQQGLARVKFQRPQPPHPSDARDAATGQTAVRSFRPANLLFAFCRLN